MLFLFISSSDVSLTSSPLIFVYYFFLLSLERVFYHFLWVYPKYLTQIARTLRSLGYDIPEPKCLFYCVASFKFIQMFVILHYAFVFHHYSFADFQAVPYLTLAICVLGMAAGQFLNLATWSALGINGVCYGCKYGIEVPWVSSFPFNVVNHPQYTGVVLFMWGIFGLFSGFSDWFFVPVIETAVYTYSMFAEQ